jgi:phosphoribosylformylglycinamidine cyclo-ligase
LAKQLSYKDSGVDIDQGNALVEHIKPLAARTRRPEVRSGVGGFGAMFAVPLDRYKEPLLVSGTDGVGTKLRVALDHNRLTGVGIDLVAMCVNDILTLGAEPLFFLDYYATAKLDPNQAKPVLTSIARGCELSGASLIGGETAEMPGMYADGDIDLAGFCVGIVEASKVVDGAKLSAGDAVIGLASSGLHSNGFSLVRKVLEQVTTPLESTFIDPRAPDASLLDMLLEPTTIYVAGVQALLSAGQPLHAMAHITGGGLTENIPRVLPEHLSAYLDRASWSESPIFRWLAEHGNIARAEMDRTFNCGIGFVICVPASAATSIVTLLGTAGVQASQIGELRQRPAHAEGVVFG